MNEGNVIYIEDKRKQESDDSLAASALFGVLDRIDSAIGHVQVCGGHDAAKSALAGLMACRERVSSEIKKLRRRVNV